MPPRASQRGQNDLAESNLVRVENILTVGQLGDHLDLKLRQNDH